MSVRMILVVLVLAGAVMAAGCRTPQTKGEARAAAAGAVMPKPPASAPATTVGAALTGAPLVKVAELLERQEELAGTPVRLEGPVVAMCHHKRTWFALRDEGAPKSGTVRVLTGPGFRVPAGSVGKQARTEGTVRLIEVPAAMARHYAKGHGLKGSAPGAEGAPVKAVVVQATGAEFR